MSDILDLVLLALAVRQVTGGAIVFHRCSYVSPLEYFRCPTNGFYADAYGCAQGKYFECVEKSASTFSLV